MIDAIAARDGVTNEPQLASGSEPVEEVEPNDGPADGLIGIGGVTGVAPADSPTGFEGPDEQPAEGIPAKSETEVDGDDARSDESEALRDELAAIREQLADTLGQLQAQLQGEVQGGISELGEQVQINYRSLTRIGQFVQEAVQVFDQTRGIVATSAETVARVEVEAQMETRRPLIESLTTVHDQLFRRVNAMEAGEEKPNVFVVQLFETLEAEIRQNGIEIIRPEPGGAADLTCMKLLEQLKCPFFRKQNSVAKVYRCGFRYIEPERIIRKAEVAVYRKGSGE